MWLAAAASNADTGSELLNSGMEGVGVGQLLGSDISEGKAVL